MPGSGTGRERGVKWRRGRDSEVGGKEAGKGERSGGGGGRD